MDRLLAQLYNTSVQSKDTGLETKARHREAFKETFELRGIPMTSDMRFLIEAYLELEVFLAGEWFRASMVPGSREFTRLFIDCVPPRLYSALQIESRPGPGEAGAGGGLFDRYY